MPEFIEFDLKGIDGLVEHLDPKIVDKALNRTLNVMQRKVRTLVSKDVRAFYNVSASRVKQDLTVKSTTEGGKPSRLLMYAGSRIGLTRFGGQVRTVKVQATSSRGKKFMTRREAAFYKVTRTGSRQRAQHKTGAMGFAAQGANGNAQFFARQSNGKLAALKGPAVAHMVNLNAEAKVIDLLDKEMAPEFSNNMNFYLGKQVGLY